MKAVQPMQWARDTLPSKPAGTGAVEDGPFGAQQRIRSRITQARTGNGVAVSAPSSHECEPV